MGGDGRLRAPVALAPAHGAPQMTAQQQPARGCGDQEGGGEFRGEQPQGEYRARGHGELGEGVDGGLDAEPGFGGARGQAGHQVAGRGPPGGVGAEGHGVPHQCGT
jgi:hypothetical protein